jgi:hypothetical protein
VSLDENEGTVPLCPSSWPELPHSVIMGIVGGKSSGVHTPCVTYLQHPVPVSGNVLTPIQGAQRLTEAFRFAAPCMRQECRNWTGTSCHVAELLVQILPPVVETLPACTLRSDCQWFQQEGGSACKRCPQVVTDDERLIAAADRAETALSSMISADIFRIVVDAIT